MSTRQYIGARYVPKLFENPDGTNNWLQNYAYEALTIVTYLNASYTSKKPVPASTSNPASAPDYWVLSGNYNAQVEQYRQTVEEYKEQVTSFDGRITQNATEIDEINGEITNIKNVTDHSDLMVLSGKTMGFIGDSWGTGNGVSNGEAYPEVVCNRLSMGCVNKCVGGAGFLRRAGGTGKTFTDQLNDLVTENGTTPIDYVCVMGGFNDVNNSYDAEEIREACLTLINNIRSKLPNAKIIWMGFNMRCNVLDEKFRQAMSYVNNAYKQCATGIIYGARNWQFDLIGYENYFNNDCVHPNVTGHRIIANQIINTLLGGGGNQMCATQSFLNGFSPFTGFTATGDWCVRRCGEDVIITIGTLTNENDISTGITTSTYKIEEHYCPALPEVVQVYTHSQYDVVLMINSDGTLNLQKKSTGDIPSGTTFHIPTIRYPLYSKGTA